MARILILHNNNTIKFLLKSKKKLISINNWKLFLQLQLKSSIFSIIVFKIFLYLEFFLIRWTVPNFRYVFVAKFHMTLKKVLGDWLNDSLRSYTQKKNLSIQQNRLVVFKEEFG